MELEISVRQNNPMPLDLMQPGQQSGTGVPSGTQSLPASANPLDSDDSRRSLAQLESWWAEQIDLHAENRREQLLDCDYYDRDQWSPQDRKVVLDRHQAPVVFDLVHPIVDWIVGTERRTRVDWAVHPTQENDEPSAEAKEKLLKFISDTSGAEFERSRAFKDAVVSGVGWTRSFANNNPRKGVPVMERHVPWKAVRWDSYSRRNDLEDCRSVTVEHYLDTDYAMAMWPDRASFIHSGSSGLIDPMLELVTDDIMLPSMFNMLKPGQYGSIASGAYSTSRLRGMRSRIRLLETEYRRPIVTQMIRLLTSGYDELTNQQYDPQNAEMRDLYKRQVFAIDQSMEDQMWLAIWHPGFMVAHMRSPYNHNQFSLTPIWCYRRHRDGMPYGAVRGLRDPQDEYNKRRTKAIFCINAQRVIYEEDALSDGTDVEEFRDQLSRPDGMVKVAKRALQDKKIEIEKGIDIADAQIKMMESTREFMFEGSGVTRENLGLQSGDLSGRAILAKQQQGSVGTAEMFDNDRYAMQLSGRKTLSNCEQFITLPMQIRVLGDNGDPEWVKINHPYFDPTEGRVKWLNDITATQCKFVVDQRDYRETVRMAMSEMLFEIIGKMPAEMGIKLLDLAAELADFPNKDEFIKRVRQMNGMGPQDPAVVAQQQKLAQQADEMHAAQVAKLGGGAAKEQAAAGKLTAETSHENVKTKATALDTAGLLSSMLPLAPAADRLAAIPRPQALPMLPPPQPSPPPQDNGYPAQPGTI